MARCAFDQNIRMIRLVVWFITVKFVNFTWEKDLEDDDDRSTKGQ